MKKDTMVLNFLIFMVSISQIKSQAEPCYSEIASPYVYFNSRTSYFAGRGSQMNAPKDCEPVFLWGLFRHGTRFPEIEIIKSIDKVSKLRDEIIQNHKNGMGTLCETDLINLEKWSSNLTADLVNELDLAPQGKKDHIFLARNMKEKFPTLLKIPKKENFMFQSSGQSRARESAIAFTNELIGTQFTTAEGNHITEDEMFLQLNEHCERYSKEVENNPLCDTEKNLFRKSAYFQKIIAEISIRLGFIQLLSFDSVKLMYDICGYENAWYVKSKPPFCAAFQPNDLEAFDYLFDISSYYKRGYGNPLLHQVGCPLVRDMMVSLQDAAQNKTEKGQKGKFLFSHSEAIIPLTAKLGLNKDEDSLRHDNYQKMIQQRKWRLSLFDTFASNIIAVLYKCSSQNGVQTKVVIYQNERPAVFTQCSNSSLCSLENLQLMYADVLNEKECNSKFCQLSPEKASSGYSNLPNLRIFVIIFLIVRVFY